MNTIEIANLAFTYQGSAEPAIRDIGVSIAAGEILGFLGPSGAGKSTTQKIMIGVLKGYRGSVAVLGTEVTALNQGFYERIGVAFETPNLYTRFTARENLKFFASLYRTQTRDVGELLDAVELRDDADTRVQAFSKGMKTRLNLCRALVNRPEILFLDEPTSGLDPVSARNVKKLILEASKAGATVFLTTHNMHLADEVCDRVAFMVDGSIRAIDTPQRLKRVNKSREVHVGYTSAGGETHRTFPIEGLGSNAAFLELLRTEDVTAIHSDEASLEDVFVRVTGRQLR